jgi:phosphoglycerol transferase MdoB-like AlkP superfamily enzyme
VLAAIRPDDWNLPLLVHVLGAMVLVGALVTAVVAQLLGWRRQESAAATTYARLAFRTLLLVALPAWFVMRVGAEWIYSKEGFGGDDEPAWLGIGYITADGGGILLLLSIILSGLGVRRLRRGDGERSVLARIATVLVALALLMYVIAVWAMSGKPD